ncbi:MAG: lipopolysaccharide heptosyltransferase I [Burkholderiales bacterium]|nr:lipopolysaccharide heptosyltransferase I [Burkholderiales bacterium]
MPRILLIKTSSLGDVVHNLPVVADIVAALPDVTIDWVVEEAFAGIPRLHPRVSRVLPVAVRRWRRALWHPAVWGEIRAFFGHLRDQSYDAVIDSQGLLKSAWIAGVARGVSHGLDRASSREPLGLFYDHRHPVPWGQHAVERNRQLAAQALGYTVSAPVQYGISAAAQTFAWLDNRRPHAVLLHATSADRKLWPEERWIALGQALAAQGISSVLPWGTAAEHERSLRLMQKIPQAVVPERLDIAALAALLAQARVVVGTDTGLTHLAGALGVPTVGIYCATDPAATGLYACARGVNLGGVGKAPVVGEVVAAVKSVIK